MVSFDRRDGTWRATSPDGRWTLESYRFKGEAEAAELLLQAGFELQETGGGVLVWTREEGDVAELQVAADTVDYPPPADPGAPVRMWSLHHGRPDGEETHYPTLLDALDALAEEGAEDADRCRGCGRVEEGSAGECQSCFDA